MPQGNTGNISWKWRTKRCRKRNMHRKQQDSRTGLHGKAISSVVSATFCSKRATSSVRRYTVSSASPVIITNHVLTRNRYLTSRTPLTCSGMTDNHIRRQGISCTSLPGKRASLTTGSKSKPDGRLTMWWKEIMSSSRKEDFQ